MQSWFMHTPQKTRNFTFISFTYPATQLHSAVWTLPVTFDKHTQVLYAGFLFLSLVGIDGKQLHFTMQCEESCETRLSSIF